MLKQRGTWSGPILLAKGSERSGGGGKAGGWDRVGIGTVGSNDDGGAAKYRRLVDRLFAKGLTYSSVRVFASSATGLAECGRCKAKA